LAERRAGWEQRQASVRLYDQQATLPVLKAERPALAGVPSPVVQQGAVRIDRAFQACFRRVREGAEQPGSPRCRGTGRDERSPCPQVPVGCNVVGP
jgi:putative transposase